MFKPEENKVETPALDQLIRLGWDYVPGAALAEREYYRDVVLVNYRNS